MADPSGSHRRPIWASSAGSRVAQFLAKRVTLTSASIFFFLLLVAFYLFREVRRDVLFIEPFNVPKQYADVGLTGEVLANHVSDALDEMEREAITKEKRVGLRPDKFLLPGDLPAMIDVEVPGTKLGLKTLVEILREVLNISPNRVRGDVVLAAGRPAAPVTITVRVSTSRHPDAAMRHTLTAGNPAEIPQRVADAILHDVNPFALGVYRNEHNDMLGVEEIGRELMASRDKVDSARGHNFMAVVYASTQNWKDAAAECEQTTKLDPKFAAAYSNWGMALDAMDRFDDGEAKYKKAIQLDPKLARTYVNWVGRCTGARILRMPPRNSRKRCGAIRKTPPRTSIGLCAGIAGPARRSQGQVRKGAGVGSPILGRV